MRAKWEEQVGREVRGEPKERGGARLSPARLIVLIVLPPSWRWRDMRLRLLRPESLG